VNDTPKNALDIAKKPPSPIYNHKNFEKVLRSMRRE
jgi:hypothetical protein